MCEDILRAYVIRTDEETGQLFQGGFESVPNELDALQKLVSYNQPRSLIQVVPFGEIKIICDEEGKMKEFPVTRFWLDDKDRVIDVFVGNIICCRGAGDELISIREEDVLEIRKHLKPAVKLGNGKYMLLPTEEWLPEYEEGVHKEMTKIEKVAIYERKYPKGTRLRLLKAIEDPWTRKEVGDIFISSGVVDAEYQLIGHWEKGGSLSIRLHDDSFEIVKE